MDFSISCSTWNSRKLLFGLRNAIAGRWQGEMLMTLMAGMWVPPIHCVANIVGFTSGPGEPYHLCEMQVVLWTCFGELVGDSKDLQLRNVAVSHTALFKSIQAGVVGLPGTTGCGRGRKSLILIAPALEQHPGAPSVSAMPACQAWSKPEHCPFARGQPWGRRTWTHRHG